MQPACLDDRIYIQILVLQHHSGTIMPRRSATIVIPQPQLEYWPRSSRSHADETIESYADETIELVAITVPPWII